MAALGCSAHSWLQHHCRPGHPVPTAPGHTAAHPRCFSVAQQTLGAPKSWALPHHNSPRRMCTTSGSVQAGRTEGRAKAGLPQKRGHLRGVTASPFSGWLVSLSEPPSCPQRPLASGHALAPPPEGAEGAGSRTSPRQTDRHREKDRKGKAESVGRQKTPSKKIGTVGMICFRNLRGETGEEAGRTEGDIDPAEPCRNPGL